MFDGGGLTTVHPLSMGMEIRGTRRCRSCDTEWSYYETGNIACPACGSMYSIGVDDRALHTDGATELDLTKARHQAGKASIEDAATAAIEATREYVRVRGFVDAGDLRRLDDVVLGAYELREVSRQLTRTLTRDDATDAYFLTLLEDVPDGERPTPQTVPDTLHAARGLSIAAGVDAYLSDFTAWLDATDTSHPQELDRVVAHLRDHRRRLEALDGDMPPADAERLVTAIRALATYAKHGESHDLETARSALDAIA